MAVELKRIAKVLALVDRKQMADSFLELSEEITEGIWTHGVYENARFGKVFAFEVDGFGGVNNIDDANIPSLLSLPDLGFVNANNEVYQNTRAMILSKQGNPYYLSGKVFNGIGGPHIGIRYAWPMSHLVAMRTTNDDEEIKASLELIKKSTGGLGLMHESVHVDIPDRYTRSWFAWCNSEFAKTLLFLAKTKPYLLFGTDSAPYNLEDVDLKDIEA